MIASNATIFKLLKEGYIKIEPFDIKNLYPQCYYLHLNNVIEYYDENLLDTKKENKIVSIDINDDINKGEYILQPNKLYIASTIETVNTIYPYALSIHPMTNIGRLGLSVRSSENFFYVSSSRKNITLELYCIHPIKIYYKMPICQAYFHKVY